MEKTSHSSKSDLLSGKVNTANSGSDKIAKARSLIGKIIRKDGREYGCIIEIKSYGKGSDTKCIAITDIGLKIDADSILRMIANAKRGEVFYPEGSLYSRSSFRIPRSSRGGSAITGSSEIDDKSIDFYRRNYKDGYKS